MAETKKDRKMISSKEVAGIIGKDERTVQNLAKKGILTCEKEGRKNIYDLYTVIREYCDYLAKSCRKQFSSMEEEKTFEDIRIKRAKAEVAELELQELKGNLHAAEDVEAMTLDLVMVIRSSFLALPGRVATELAEIEDAAVISEKLRSEVYSILKDLANYEYDPEEYKKRVRERRGWLMDEREDE
ncbi:MAG: protoporphyrinogen oxidase [Lachnospiraceae bacterium]|jgi:phage terminase Nu1 subunit (DNA packaging protein)|nr:protoporphyrinogen oxidase [Lachnospiraceae bacterium]